jgi:hypothetical protein
VPLTGYKNKNSLFKNKEAVCGNGIISAGPDNGIYYVVIASFQDLCWTCRSRCSRRGTESKMVDNRKVKK